MPVFVISSYVGIRLGKLQIRDVEEVAPKLSPSCLRDDSTNYDAA